MKTEHTNTPYKIKQSGDGNAGIMYSIVTNKKDIAYTPREMYPESENAKEALANADFICRACNSYEELLKACQWANKIFGTAAGLSALIDLQTTEEERRDKLNALNNAIRKAEGKCE